MNKFLVLLSFILILNSISIITKIISNIKRSDIEVTNTLPLNDISSHNEFNKISKSIGLMKNGDDDLDDDSSAPTIEPSTVAPTTVAPSTVTPIPDDAATINDTANPASSSSGIDGLSRPVLITIIALSCLICGLFISFVGYKSYKNRQQRLIARQSSLSTVDLPAPNLSPVSSGAQSSIFAPVYLPSNAQIAQV